MLKIYDVRVSGSAPVVDFPFADDPTSVLNSFPEIPEAVPASLAYEIGNLGRRIVSHTTNDPTGLDALISEIPLRSNIANRFGPRPTLYLGESGYSFHEVKHYNQGVVAYGLSRRARIVDRHQVPSQSRPPVKWTLEHGYHGIRFRGNALLRNDIFSGDIYSQNIALFTKPRNLLTPIGVYPIPFSLMSQAGFSANAVSPLMIHGMRYIGAAGTVFALAEAANTIYHSSNPLLETAHQTSTFSAVILGGARAGRAAILPCYRVGKLWPPFAPYTIPACIGTASVVGGTLSAFGVDAAWQLENLATSLDTHRQEREVFKEDEIMLDPYGGFAAPLPSSPRLTNTQINDSGFSRRERAAFTEEEVPMDPYNRFAIPVSSSYPVQEATSPSMMVSGASSSTRPLEEPSGSSFPFSSNQIDTLSFIPQTRASREWREARITEVPLEEDRAPLQPEITEQLSNLRRLQEEMHERLTTHRQRNTHDSERSVNESMETLNSAVQVASNVATICGNRPLATQIGGIYSSGMQVVGAISSLATAFTPLGVVNLFSGISGIIAQFASDDGDDMLEELMYAVRQIAAQVEELRKEMHERFNAISYHLSMQDRLALMRFLKLYAQGNLIQSKLHRLHNDMQQGFRQTRQYLDLIRDDLQSLTRHLIFSNAKEVAQITESVVKHRTLVRENSNRFPKSVATLFTKATHSIREKSFTAIPTPHEERLLPDFFGNQINRLARKFERQESEIYANPHLFVLLTTAILELTYDQYPVPNCEEEKYRICRKDIKRIEQLKHETENLLAFIDRLQNCPEYPAELIGRYQEEVHQLCSVIYSWLIEKRETRAKHLEDAVDAHLSIEYRQEKMLERLENRLMKDREGQTHQLKPGQYGNWWVRPACDFRGHPLANQHPYHHTIPINSPARRIITDHLEQHKNAYETDRLQAMQNKIAPSLEKIEKERESDLEVKVRDLVYIKPHYHDTTYHPMPLLPITETFFHSFFAGDPQMASVHRAIALNLGHIEIRYHPPASRQESAVDLIGLSIAFISQQRSEEFVVKQIEIPFPRNFYNPSEKSWWFFMGGRYPRTDESRRIDERKNRNQSGHPVHLPLYVPQVPEEPALGELDKIERGYYDDQFSYPELDVVRDLVQKSEMQYELELKSELLDCITTERGNPIFQAAHRLAKTATKIQRLTAFLRHDQASNPENDLHQLLYSRSNRDPNGFCSMPNLKANLQCFMGEQPLEQQVDDIQRKALANSEELKSILLTPRDSSSGSPRDFIALDRLHSLLAATLEIYSPHSVSANQWFPSKKYLRAEVPPHVKLVQEMLTNNLDLMLRLSLMGADITRDLNATIALCERNLSSEPSEREQQLQEMRRIFQNTFPDAIASLGV